MNVLVDHADGRSTGYTEAIESAGHSVVFPDRKLSEEELIAFGQGAHCLVRLAASRKLIESLPDLRAVVTHAIGYDKIDVDAATEHGVLVCSSPSAENIYGVAETAIGLMVALAKKLKKKERTLRAGGWALQADRGTLIAGKTIGIIGLGRIGQAVARRLSGWDAELIAYSPRPKIDVGSELGVRFVDLNELLRLSDVIMLHVPSTKETKGMLGRTELAKMRLGSMIVNLARGGIVDEQALAIAINDEKIGGAALDVFGNEPLEQGSPLLEADPDRLILTPHNASSSVESRVGNVRVATENVLQVLQGKIPENAVNPEIAARWRGRLTS